MFLNLRRMWVRVGMSWGRWRRKGERGDEMEIGVGEEVVQECGGRKTERRFIRLLELTMLNELRIRWCRLMVLVDLVLGVIGNSERLWIRFDPL